MALPDNPQLMSEKERSGKIICSITDPETENKIEWVMNSENITISKDEIYILRSSNNNNEESD